MSGYEAALTPYALIYMVRRRARSIRDLTKLRRVEGRGSGSVYFLLKNAVLGLGLGLGLVSTLT